jgi:hypothetical protein
MGVVDQRVVLWLQVVSALMRVVCGCADRERGF